MSQPIRVLIVDDEPLARDILRDFLSEYDELSIVGEAENGETAVEAILAHEPDLVFLDIQMPGMDGFEVIKTLGTDNAPQIIFVTAFDEYAIKAFEVNVVDYLLKPFSKSRLRDAVGRIQHRTDDTVDDTRSRLAALLDQLGAGNRYPTRLAIKSDGTVRFVKLNDITSIEAAEKYVQIHANGQTHIMRHTMQAMADMLPTEKFVRIHRSSIVNLDAVKEIQPYRNGDYIFVLNDGTRLTSGKNYRETIRDLVKN